MLLSLTIKDLVLIDTLDVSVEPALSVLTGETGAGKSILLDALGLALGMRGDASLVRQGAEQAIVSAEFFIKDNTQINQLLMEHGLAENPETLTTLVFRRILSRTGGTAGRSRAFINDQMVSVGLLRLIGDRLLEIHGQFDRLLDPTSYRLLLDEFVGEQDLRFSVRQTFHAWQKAKQQLQEAEESLAHLRQNEDFIRHQLDELKKLNPTVGEEETLLQERSGLAHVGKLNEALGESIGHLSTPSIETHLRAAAKSLQRVQDIGGGKINTALVALEKALTEVIEATAQIEDVGVQLANSPKRLQEIDERLYAIRAAARKHGVVGDALVELQEKIATQLSSLDHVTDQIEEYVKATATARAEYHQAATHLRQRRQDAAHHLEQTVMAELPALKLPHAQFNIHLGELPETQWGEFGLDRIDFMVAMNKGQNLCSLSKSASGGELARLMLALKVALASRSAIPTIIFDEIDTGVGGAVAAAIGERLAKLSKHVQVLAITHSPQVAACANHHYLVSKEDLGTHMRTSIRALSQEERQDELARMLSGLEVTTEARAAAERLLNVR
ncbi:MAG: DNA repair protein RecN [Alphaproteobacteria bacterium]|nr:DNA repair protein RecN [Alphaproteobacteria bacterium]